MVTNAIVPAWLWIGFTLLIIALLAIDLGVFHRKAHEVSAKESLIWFFVWVSVAFLFDGFVYYRYGTEKALEFLTGFLVEKSLSVDNIFVFVVIFDYFAIQLRHQHRVLFWGILLALILRAIFIFLGVSLIAKFHGLLYIMGAFLIYTGIKIVTQKEGHIEPAKNPVTRLAKKFLPFTHEFHGQDFYFIKDGRRVFTPIMLAFIVLNVTDVLFAMDSIPAVIAVTRDPFIVYTSNIFAILGLRSLYFLLAAMVTKLEYLKYGLGAVLTFVGIKMVGTDLFRIPTLIALLVILLLLGAAVLVSLVLKPKKKSS